MSRAVPQFVWKLSYRVLATCFVPWVALAVLLAACSAPVTGPDTNGDTPDLPQAAATSRAPAGWQVFTLPEAGYSLMLPPGVVVRSGKNAAGVYTARFQFDLPQGSGYQGLVVRVEPNRGGQGLADLVTGLYRLSTLSATEQPPAELLAQAQTLLVAGLSAAKVTTSGQDFTIVLPYGDRVYYVAPVHDVATTTLDPQAMQLFEQILSTFHVSR